MKRTAGSISIYFYILQGSAPFTRQRNRRVCASIYYDLAVPTQWSQSMFLVQSLKQPCNSESFFGATWGNTEKCLLGLDFPTAAMERGGGGVKGRGKSLYLRKICSTRVAINGKMLKCMLPFPIVWICLKRCTACKSLLTSYKWLIYIEAVQ